MTFPPFFDGTRRLGKATARAEHRQQASALRQGNGNWPLEQVKERGGALTLSDMADGTVPRKASVTTYGLALLSRANHVDPLGTRTSVTTPRK